jgi:hypothetical protein
LKSVAVTTTRVNFGAGASDPAAVLECGAIPAFEEALAFAEGLELPPHAAMATESATIAGTMAHRRRLLEWRTSNSMCQSSRLLSGKLIRDSCRPVGLHVKLFVAFICEFSCRYLFLLRRRQSTPEK